METMTDRREVAQNTVSANVLAGKAHEFLTRPSIVRAFLTGEIINIFATLQVGSKSFLQDQEVSAANRFPLTPDDFVVEAAGMAGERILLTYRNAGAGAGDAFTRIEIQPVL